jgi:hypothetical protein
MALEARSMIDVDEVLRHLPRFDTFCSVKKLHELVDRLRQDRRFTIDIAGLSVNGVPIHHLRFGSGTTKALFVAFPHCMEPIGGLTVYSLLSLLHQSNGALLAADVEWHIVPCIDPDGALLNEGWTQQRFSLGDYMRGYHVQANSDQIDGSFPIDHKRLKWDQPSHEARILQRLLDRFRPDFYFWLHNATIGGAFYFISRDLGDSCYQQIYRLLSDNDVPVQHRPIHREISARFGDGIVELPSVKRWYDYLERTTPAPSLTIGETSAEYLSEINPGALIFVAEIGYARHPDDESKQSTGQNLRQFKLRVEADSKFLAAAIIEEWEKVQEEVDRASPFFRAMKGGMVLPDKEKICEGGWPLQRYPTRNTLFEPQYDRVMTEGDRLDACMADGGFMFLKLGHQFVRLLRASPQTRAIRAAIERLEPAFDQALAELGRHIDLNAFQPFDCDTLARVQLGSGLIALNSILAGRPS